VVSGSLITDGNVQLGDSSNDILTINASTVSIPNNLNFDSNTLYIDSVNNRIGIGKVPNVTFDVSGTLNTVGADKPSTIFNGDTFISGAFGVSDYIQMNPVGSLRIPTNKSASYIYTSGSTNDLYFTQYAPGTNFTNTTRLRWLEGQLTTGLLHGGVLSTANGSTTFSITSGSGLIVSYNAALGSDPYPTVNFISWPAYVSSSLTYVTSSLITYIGINPSGGIIQQTSPFTLAVDSNFITIGRVLHQSGSVTNGTTTQPIVAYGTNHWQDDFTRAFGPLKVSGHILAASSSAGVGTLGLTKTAGDSYVIGKNYVTDPNNPNNITSATDTAVTVSKIYRAYVSGSTLKLDTGVGNAGFTTINPTVYNNNGTLTAVGANASIQRVYWYPNSVSRSYTVYYGSQTYADPLGFGQNALDNAQQNIASEPFTEGENTAGAAILVGYILALGTATDLTNPAQARIIQAGISRGAGAGGGGGVAVGSTTPGGLDTYVQFNDGGSTFGGDAGLTYNKTTDTLTISGDLAINGGDLTSTSTTFNLVNSTATTVNFAGGASTALNIGNSAGTNTISGTSKFSQGLSGSLTKLTDGTSYLIAGGNMSVVSGSNGSGAITLSTVNSGTIHGVTAGTGLTGGGASGTVTLSINNSVVATISGSTFTGVTKHNAGLSGSLTKLTDGTSYLIAGSGLLISTGSTGAITLSRSGSIDGDITAVTAGNGLTGGGLSGSVSLAIDNGIVATVSGTTFTGVTKHNAGLSGSLTKLVDGTSYLIAGAGTVISTGSNGAVTITSSGTPGGSTTQVQYNNAGVFAGSSTLTFNNTNNILASLNVSATSVTASNIIAAATSVNLFNTTATTINFAGAATSALNIGNSLGINTISGTIRAPQGVSGSLTKLTDGTSYLIAGTNVTISTGSNGSITISSTGGGGAAVDDFFDSTTTGSVFTTGSFAFRGQESVSSPSNKGTDVFFYVSGSTNITGSNAKISLFGGDITSSGSLAIANGGTIVGNLTAINNVGVLGSLTVMSNGLIAGNATVSGSTTTNTLFVNTGNVIGAPGTGANVLSLLSSGNIVMKLDVDNNALGHKFDVQDYLGISQFSIGENGNAEISGSLVVTGSLIVSGSATLGIVPEVMSGSNAIGGTFAFDTTRQSIFYVNNPTSNITANFTNVPTIDNRIISTTVILSQSAVARIVSAVQIAGVASTINWANNVTPTGNANKQDVFGFNLIRSGSAWKTLGQMSTYG
jgi:hypothetical protein